MIKNKKHTKSGATSIYVVVVSALLFSVITVSFVRIITREAYKTTSDELSRAAYDSALAGVEDARVAIKRYNDCKENPSVYGTCEEIISAIDSSSSSSDGKADCDKIAKALGRITSTQEQEVLLQESASSGSNTVQAYTCVMTSTVTADYRSTLSSSSRVAVIPLRPSDGVSVDSITGVSISWYSSDDEKDPNKYNYANNDNKFVSLDTTTPTPPTISATIIQTATEYQPSDFENSVDGKTDRGTVFLNPTKDGDKTHIQKDIIVASNDHSATINKPQQIRCKTADGSFTPQVEDFACTATIEIPEPIGGSRGADTFVLVVSLPYGQPSTDFTVQMCTDKDTTTGDCKNDSGDPSVVGFRGVQVAVDSTGRANDMYSRVEARLEFTDLNFPYPEFGILATGDDGSIDKNFYVTNNCWEVKTSDGSTSTTGCDNFGEAK